MACNCNNKKRIGVLTSGGDAPGMNAGVRAVTLTAINLGYEVVGIYGGYKGLIDNYCYNYRGEADANGKYTNHCEPDGKNLINELSAAMERDVLGTCGKTDGIKILSARDVDDIIDKSGTILLSDRCDEFAKDAGMEMAAETCRRLGILGLVTIGGDGTLSGATEFSMKQHINCIGFPASIDNDLVVTDNTIGLDTAINTVMEMADNARYTCNSHRRCEVIEVMGRGAGDIALLSGIASGANAIILKEAGFDKVKTNEAVLAKLEKLRRDGKRDFIVVLAEGVPLDLDTGYGKEYGENLAKYINNNSGDTDNASVEEKRKTAPGTTRPDFIETKFVRLAHLVRGGIPTVKDRVLASRMGEMAVKLLNAGENDKVIVEQGGKLVALNISYALAADKIYKIKLNKSYAENDALSEGGKKDYKKYGEKYEKFSAFLSAEEKAEMDRMADEKLAQFRELYAESTVISD